MVGVELLEVFDDDESEVVDFDAEVAIVVGVDDAEEVDDEEVDDSNELLLTTHASTTISCCCRSLVDRCGYGICNSRRSSTQSRYMPHSKPPSPPAGATFGYCIG